MYKIGDNIISSLGFTTEENFNAVKQGVSGVKQYTAETFGLPEAFMASLIDKQRLNDEFSLCCKQRIASQAHHDVEITDLEKAAILSVLTANQEAKIDLSDEKVLFVLSTTKGNVDKINNAYCDMLITTKPELNTEEVLHNTQIYLWHTAQLIASFFGNQNTPIVVSNACISGAAAQIAAMRELENGNYAYAVVVGVDFLSKFIVSGFQSFKALSSEICRPFDKERSGLNLGEAAATLIFSNQTQGIRHKTAIALINGAIRNDANHISGPSRTGEGSLQALNYVLSEIAKSEISFINAHGTATPYNDAMEAIAITRAGLENVPVNSLKSFFGHTLGTAGVLESIISMRALEENLVLQSLNCDEQDFENKINISQENHVSNKKYFIKMLSGFGGCNAALLFGKVSESHELTQNKITRETSHDLWIKEVFIKKHISLKFKTSTEITEYYRSLSVDYPKFFKMDNLSKLGFLASEMLFNNDAEVATHQSQYSNCEDIAVICFNRSSSLCTDTKYQKTIQDNKNYFPSPSLFVYTLPNIVTGEIAIRNKFFGETSFYICENFDAKQIFCTTMNVFSDKNTNFALVSWVESFGDIHQILMFLVEKNGKEGIVFNENELKKYITN
jgi:3-oxoacyl-[acyl-carrier-protein] synthase-1